MDIYIFILCALPSCYGYIFILCALPSCYGHLFILCALPSCYEHLFILWALAGCMPISNVIYKYCFFLRTLQYLNERYSIYTNITLFLTTFQSYLWTSGSRKTGLISSRVPFLVEITKATFEQLDRLLSEVCEGVDGRSDWPPTQDRECMVVSTLNLLNLQVGVSSRHNTDGFLEIGM